MKLIHMIIAYLIKLAKSWKPKFESLGNLIKAVLDLTKCIVDIKSLRSQYINLDTPEMVISSAHIPIAVYWTIISIVACASMVIDLPGSSHEYMASATETWVRRGEINEKIKCLQDIVPKLCQLSGEKLLIPG
ncbi:protein SIEVE ELEMENT OCCLUSION B-like [Daucus carota subsp. sativus]|uniref:protein SIEVE ELEMENT OCCLUSION B-like n=1 Tax=Daucus carota subsp. sativus TaxID=79200 RepID=UPI003083AB27